MISAKFKYREAVQPANAATGNPIPGLKKRRFDFYTRAIDTFLIVRLDRSRGEKNRIHCGSCRGHEELSKLVLGKSSDAKL